MPTEELENELRRMLARAAADIPDPEQARQRLLQRNYRPGRGHRRVAAGITAATAAAAVVLGLGLSGAFGSAPAGPGGQQAQTAAYVVSRAESALAAASSRDLVESARWSISGARVNVSGLAPNSSQFAEWTYRQRSKLVSYGANGQPTSLEGSVTVPNCSSACRTTQTSVDYQDRTWTRLTYTAVALALPSECARAELEAESPGISNGDAAATLRTALRCGQFTLAGTTLVDGVEALELKLGPKPGPVRTTTTSETIWVNPSSYLPVRSVATARPGGTVHVDYRWLAPSPANVAELNVTIPPGFTEVPS